MQRLFSTFPEGWPGAGLAFLRSITAIAVIDVSSHLWPALDPVTLAIEAGVAIATVMLVAGAWTPVAGITMAVLQVLLFALYNGDAAIHILLAGVGTSLAMTGPGAWSIDARRFGRKRLILPER